PAAFYPLVDAHERVLLTGALMVLGVVAQIRRFDRFQAALLLAPVVVAPFVTSVWQVATVLIAEGIILAGRRPARPWSMWMVPSVAWTVLLLVEQYEASWLSFRYLAL